MEKVNKTMASDAEKGIEPVVFTIDNFDKKKKAPTKSEELITVKDVVGEKVSNQWKALAELNDTEIKDKFIDVETAVEFLNNIKKEQGEKPVSFTTFSKAFFKEYRDTINAKVL